MKRTAILAFALVLVAGCNGATDQNETVDALGLTNSQVDLTKGAEDIDPAAWLVLPRDELARRCDEIENAIAEKDRLQQQGHLVYQLLKDSRWPLSTPVFRAATYRPSLGISLPPYLADGVKDSTIAEHLDRFGDHEAAARIVDPKDQALVKRIEANSARINYPVEWTRFVALTEQAAQIDLASDNFEGARKLIALQRKLRGMLNDETRKSPLGVALLGRGLGTLKQAAAAWIATSRIDLGQQAQSLLAEFADTAAWSPTLPTTREQLAGFFAAGKGPGLIATSALRVLDLLDLPLPHEAADTAAAFVDKNGELVEIWIGYRPVLEAQQHYKAEQFASGVEELRVSHAEDLGVDFPRRVWDMPECQIEVVLTRRNEAVGAMAILRTPKFDKKAPSGGELPRIMGSVSLDRTFEANRRLCDWKKRANTLVLADKAIKDVNNPLTTRSASRIELSRDAKGADLLARVAIEYAESPKEANETLGEILRPIFASAGRPELGYRNEGRGPTIDVAFFDAETGYAFQFPQRRSQPISLVIADVSTRTSAERETAARKQDLEDRAARIEAGSPLERLPRSREGIALGMSKAEFANAIPDSPKISKRDIAGGMMASFLGTPAPGDAVIREWAGRFDDDRLVELRLRYADVPGGKAGSFLRKLDALKAECGAPETTVAPSVWTDIAPKSTTARFAWQDDLTSIVARQDSSGVEVTIRECPLDHADGKPLPPLEYLSRGTSMVSLGMTRDQLAKLSPKQHEGSLMIAPAANDPYDVILVWMERDRVARIVARLKQGNLPPRSRTEASRTILENWARDGARLGWPTRQDVSGNLLESLSSRDDRTRFRMFWRDDRTGVANFSEWRDVPVPQ